MDCDGHPENVLSRDEILANVSIYWLTSSAASSARLYWQSFRRSKQDPVTVTMGYTIFPKDISYSSRRWAEARFKNIVHWSERHKGGHFAAFEVPEAFVDEVRTCFRQIR